MHANIIYVLHAEYQQTATVTVTGLQVLKTVNIVFIYKSGIGGLYGSDSNRSASFVVTKYKPHVIVLRTNLQLLVCPRFCPRLPDSGTADDAEIPQQDKAIYMRNERILFLTTQPILGWLWL